jgi:hypothetical protein
MKGNLVLAILLLAAPAACVGLGAGNMGSPPVAAPMPEGVAASARRTLPPGVYYASFRSDRNEIKYYALDGSTAMLVGDAFIDSGECRVVPNRQTIVVDRQNAIDVTAPCRSRMAVLQIPAGVIGRVAPTRRIVTPFANSAVVEASIDLDGHVAVGQSALLPSDQNINTVFLYASDSHDDAKPVGSIKVFTRSCSSPVSRGPGPLMGSPRGGINFDGSSNLVMSVGPPPAWHCGYQYVERFDPKTRTLSNWLMPGLLPRNAHGHVPFNVVLSSFLALNNDSLVFGIYTNERGAFAAHAGGAIYNRGAVGLQPEPTSTFTDAREPGLGSGNVQAVPVGTDRDGNVFVQSAPGGSVIVEFRRHADGNVVPVRTIVLPAEAVAYQGVVIDTRR